MVAGCLRCLCCFFTCIVVLLLGVCLHDVEASSRTHVIHRKVGDTVELPSYLPTEGVITVAYWKYGRFTVADKDGDASKNHQFKDRVELNPTNFSLTVRKLTLQDSGNFSFFSEANDQQGDTVTITLHVHEPITQQPSLKQINFTYNASVESCTFLLECSTSSDSTVTYKWTVENQTWTGPKLQHVFREQDGDTTFTCTVSNFVSEKSASRTIKCSSDTSFPQERENDIVLILSVAGGCCLIVIVIISVIVYLCHCKDRHTGSDINELTVYADITDVAIEDGTMKPCSVYETIDNRTNRATPGPQTVYDKIQSNRMRKASVSPYQDIS